MPVNVKPGTERRLANHTELLNPDLSSGSFQVNIPFPVDNIAIINETNATLAVDVGLVGDPTAEALPFLPMSMMALPIRETQTITVFWSGSIDPDAKKILFLFSDEAIQIQGGALSPSGVNPVTVSNVPDVVVSNTPNVVVTEMPQLTLAANQQIKLGSSVDVATMPAVDIATIPAVNVAADQQINAANTGIVFTATQAIGAAAVAVNVPAVGLGARRLTFKNSHAAQTIDLGLDNSVTVGGGFRLAPGESISFDIVAGTQFVIWAIASGAGTGLSVLGVK